MQKIILDVDTGTDDAVAIMMASLSEELDVLAICSVNGNRNVEITTENTLRVLQHIGRTDIPVYKGAALPMVSTLDPDRRPLVPYGDKHFDGFENHGNYLDLPPATIHEQEINAISYYIDTLMNSDGDIVLMPLGPLTNLALAMRAEPRICGKIKNIICMGGALFEGNSGPTQRAEFNWWVDPEAVEIVLRSGVPITAVPLDVTHKTCIKEREAAEFEAMGTPASTAAAMFICRRMGNYRKWQPVCDPDEAPIHDALCVAGLLDPSVFTVSKTIHVAMDFSGGTADGISVCNFKPTTRDPDGVYRPAPKNCTWVMEADREKFAAIMKKLVGKTHR